MKQKEFFGKDSIYKLKEILDEHKPKSIFLVTGKSSYEKSGASGKLGEMLKGYNAIHFTDFNPNPKLEEIENGLNIFRENKCDFLIAVGGGSPIDVAKSVSILDANPGDAVDYINKKRKIEKKGKILVAIPTTSGSGSEATYFIVFYKGKTKCSLGHEEFTLPDYAIVDPVLTDSLPKYQTACTGMDALGQAIESYWCVDSTEESKNYAAEAIKLAMEFLEEAVNNPSYKAREAMAKSANLAGKAINISRTTACHAVAYPITSYFGIPHGHAVGLTIPSMLVHNYRVNEGELLDKRGISYVKKTIEEISSLVGAKTVDEAAKKINELMNRIGLKTRLSELDIKTESDREIILKNGFNPGRVKNNPRVLTEEALRVIISEID
ncbi:MAG: phosphonoacetaldehyde reductase [Nanoarchaeota archaeon]|nr:phosphonoacetaldehyde reductase [Nanoarchaeota archaeon]